MSLALLLTVAQAAPCLAQMLSGTSSLITIPVADLPDDGMVTFGMGFVDETHSHYGRFTPISASITFLPFLEVGLRLSRKLDAELVGLGDRMVSLRLQVLTEHRRRPALLIGMHDFLASIDSENTEFNALYLVASKHLEVPVVKRLGMHMGYGTDIMAAVHHQFVGLFGGVALSPFPFLDVLAEYDGEIPSAGARLTVLGHVQLLAALQNFDTFAGGGSLRFRLP